MSNLAVSNGGEPPRKTNQPPPASFSSLPIDIVLNVLARVPRRYYPILRCVCKSLRSLLRSPEIHKTRSFLGKDSLYICFMDKSTDPKTPHWFALRRIENSTTDENVFDSIEFPCGYSLSTIAVGHEIFVIPGTHIRSTNLLIFDTQSGKFRQGPSLLVKRQSNSVGLVGGKIYVIGGHREDKIPAQVFDLKTQTLEAAPIPEADGRFVWSCAASFSLDRKVCALISGRGMTCYDPRDGSCETPELPKDRWCKGGVCVIDNVLFVYFFRFGLMWYDSQLMLWRVVYGLDIGKAGCVAMAEYYGKLAFLWVNRSLLCPKSKEIWCRMIGFDRNESGIHGTAEPSQLLRIVPRDYNMSHCLSLG
ncbi:PREDICTED: F-box/kelch-repeat protein At2g44630-like [Camelina sativa]|uniref:F-box/kelch-repeat protein At2g44630-like n=1 Tax=Camelina sativa TaxID=90675 RepID=A0ABM0ZN25_CAMSA|nr:PREDICTED: F-box/kelch-repeat protein At2g44630-like [Camelina sativa]